MKDEEKQRKLERTTMGQRSQSDDEENKDGEEVYRNDGQVIKSSALHNQESLNILDELK
jgi:hypothetical protein